jgi:hypothetical protein
VKTISFNNNWTCNGQAVTLPHDAQISEKRGAEVSNGGHGYFPGGVYTYEKTFTAPTEWEGKDVLIEFEGVYKNATISLNGKELCFHPYGYTGFCVELDDFGAGYSSLASLNVLPLDVMKLDMSMVRKATELNDFRIVESTINLAQVLDLETVVEGVETAEEAKRVTEIGCDFIQGYYYSRPLKRDEFEEYLRNDHMSASKGEDKA